MNLECCVICGTIASTRCRSCRGAICDVVCLAVCLQDHKQVGPMPRSRRNINNLRKYRVDAA